jgi:hypothetical protein
MIFTEKPVSTFPDHALGKERAFPAPGPARNMERGVAWKPWHALFISGEYRLLSWDHLFPNKNPGAMAGVLIVLPCGGD